MDSNNVMRLLDLEKKVIDLIKEKYSLIADKYYTRRIYDEVSESADSMLRLHNEYVAKGFVKDDSVLEKENKGRAIINPLLEMSWNNSGITCNIFSLVTLDTILGDRGKDSIHDLTGKKYRLAGINDLGSILSNRHILTDIPVLCGIAIEPYDNGLANVSISGVLEDIEKKYSGNITTEFMSERDFNQKYKTAPTKNMRNGLGKNGNGLGKNGNRLGKNGNGLGKNGNGLGKNGNGLGKNGNGYRNKRNDSNGRYMQDIKENFGLNTEITNYSKKYAETTNPLIVPIQCLIADVYNEKTNEESEVSGAHLTGNESYPVISLPAPPLPKRDSELTKNVYECIYSGMPHNTISVEYAAGKFPDEQITILNSKASIRLITLGLSNNIIYVRAQDSDLKNRQKYNPLIIEDK